MRGDAQIELFTNENAAMKRRLENSNKLITSTRSCCSTFLRMSMVRDRWTASKTCVESSSISVFS